MVFKLCNFTGIRLLKFFAILALVSLVVLPAQTASAAALTKVTISPEPQGALVAGYTYTARMETNKPQSTSWNSFIKYGPTRSGDQWNLASRKLFGYHSPQTNTLTFIVPENYPGPLVYIMVEGRFTPLTGDGLTQDTKVLGPFRVNYMKDITNLEAKANSDGTITLSWYNNTNMATHFEIVRVGPTSERTLIYYKPGANIGPMEFTDETTLEVEDETFIYFVKPILHDSFKRSQPDLQDNFKYVSRRVTAPKPPAFKLMPVIVPLGSFVLIGGDDESQPQEAPQDLINQFGDWAWTSSWGPLWPGLSRCCCVRSDLPGGRRHRRGAGQDFPYIASRRIRHPAGDGEPRPCHEQERHLAYQQPPGCYGER